MDSNLLSISEESLGLLKFRDLVKLGIEHGVYRKWAKKQDIIENIMTLKNNLHGEWKDAKEVLEKTTETKKSTEVENRRLTFTIDDSLLLPEARTTFEVPQSNNVFLKPEIKLPLPTEVDRRLTFNIPNSSALFTKNIEMVKVSNLNNGRKSMPEKVDHLSSKIKMLTIPSPGRVLRRTRKEKDLSKISTEAPISNKSIKIKKSLRAPGHEHSRVKQCKVTISIEDTVQVDKETLSASKSRSVKLEADKRKQSSGNVARRLLMQDNDKENIEQQSRRRKSKTEDNATVPKPNTHKVSFLSPPLPDKPKGQSHMPRKGTPARIASSNKSDTKVLPVFGSRIPRATVPAKPLTATKMPNFASIHKKRFEQMESIQDHHNKKFERARRLFGSPAVASGRTVGATPKTQPSTKLPLGKKVSPRGQLAPTSLFQFKSTNDQNINATPAKEKPKATQTLNKLEVKTLQSSTLKKKASRQHLPDIKDKNRTMLQGVRTNKRFELQMRFRNL